MNSTVKTALIAAAVIAVAVIVDKQLKKSGKKGIF